MSVGQAQPEIFQRPVPHPTGALGELGRELRSVFGDLIRLHAQAAGIRAEARHRVPEDLDERLAGLTESLGRTVGRISSLGTPHSARPGRTPDTRAGGTPDTRPDARPGGTPPHAGPGGTPPHARSGGGTGGRPGGAPGAPGSRAGRLPGGPAFAGRERGRRVAGPGHGWAALTPAELEVIRVVVSGSTNREAAAQLFLSPHTISSHLRHAYVKLGINSRVELVRAALAPDAAPGLDLAAASAD